MKRSPMLRALLFVSQGFLLLLHTPPPSSASHVTALGTQRCLGDDELVLNGRLSLKKAAIPAFVPILQIRDMQTVRNRLQCPAQDRARPREHSMKGMHLAMQIKVQSGVAGREKRFIRWWDPDWRVKQLSQLKNPEMQFDQQHLEMAELMGVTPEELAKTMGNTAGLSLDSTEYDRLLSCCVKAAQAGDLLGMQHAKEVLEKMDEVGIKPDVVAWNKVIAACAAAAGGQFRPCPFNDTATRHEMIEKLVTVVSFAGGRIDSMTLGRKWRDRFGEEELKRYLYYEGGKYSLSEVMRESSRFEVKPSDDPRRNEIILKKKERSGKASVPTQGKDAASGWVALALEFLDAMRRSKVQPDASTYTALIGMCSRAAAKGDKGMVDKSWELLSEMKSRGIQAELPTYNAMLNVCANAGDEEKAKEVLGIIDGAGLEYDAYTYTGLIRVRGLRSLDTALTVLSEMRQNDLKPTGPAYNTLLSVLQRAPIPPSKALRIANSLLEEMDKDEVERDAATYTSYLTLLRNSARAYDPDAASEALRLLSEMKQKGLAPDVKTYSACLHAIAWSCRSLDDPTPCVADAVSLLADMTNTRGLRPDTGAYTACLAVCAKAARRGGSAVVKSAREVMAQLERSKNRIDIRTFNTYMDVFANAVRTPGGSGFVQEAEKILDRIKIAGLKPNEASYTIMLKAYAMSSEAGNKRAFDQAMMQFNRMQKETVKPPLSVFNSLVAIAARGAHRAGRKGRPLDNGLLALEKLREGGLQPDGLTMSALVKCCRKPEEVALVRKIAADSNVQPSPIFLSNAIRALRYKPSERTISVVTSLLDNGEELGFRAGKEEGPGWEDGALIYSAAMDHFIRCRKGMDAVALLDRARDAGGRPNAFMISLAIKGALQAGKPDKAKEVAAEVTRDHIKVTPLLQKQISQL